LDPVLYEQQASFSAVPAWGPVHTSFRIILDGYNSREGILEKPTLMMKWKWFLQKALTLAKHIKVIYKIVIT